MSERLPNRFSICKDVEAGGQGSGARGQGLRSIFHFSFSIAHFPLLIFHWSESLLDSADKNEYIR